MWGRLFAAALLAALAVPGPADAELTPDRLSMAKELARECAIMQAMLERDDRFEDRISRQRFLRMLEGWGADDGDLREVERVWEDARATAPYQASAKDIWIRRIKIYVKACHGVP